jgi:hypothetical protein
MAPGLEVVDELAIGEPAPSRSSSPAVKSPNEPAQFPVASSEASSICAATQPFPASPDHIVGSPAKLTPPASNAGPSISPVSQKSVFKPSPAPALKEPAVTSSQLQTPLLVTSPTRLPDDGPRSALFDDHVASAHVPGSLHLASESTIQRLVERQGAISLIRQLAEDLAHRDRELVSFRRRAEERERALKRMLIEVEVSNADIEKRLAAATLVKKASKDTMRSGGDAMSYTENIDDLMQQALSEEDTFSVLDDGASGSNFGESGEIGDDITPRASLRVSNRAKPEQDSDTLSLNSNASRRSSTAKGWKGFFWGQHTSFATVDETIKARRLSNTSSSAKRTTVSAETFNVPSAEGQRTLPRTSSRTSLASVRSNSATFQQPLRRIPPPSTIYTQHHLASDQSQLKPSQLKEDVPTTESSSGLSSPDPESSTRNNSVAHWALRLVSQTPSPLPEQENLSPATNSTGLTRPRSQSTSDADGHQSRASLSMGDNLQRSKARNAAQKQQAANARSRAPSTSVNFNQIPAAKPSTFFQDIRDTAERIVPLGNNSQNTSTKKPDDAGPVEMEMIVPQESQPPTLLQGWNQHYSTDYLTDRFGFIYDKQQRSVSTKAVDSIKGSYTDRKTLENKVKTDRAVALEDHGVSPTSTNGAYASAEWAEIVYGPSSLANASSAAPFPKLAGKTEHNGSKTSAPTALVERLSGPGGGVSSMALPTNAISDAPLEIRSQLSLGATSSAEESTVRLLLGQLSDLHDSLQRDRSGKWNEFLRKVRMERRRHDDEEHGMPETAMADGELIGVATLGTEGRGGKQRWKEFKHLVLGGIPVMYRWKIWTECSGATSMKAPGYYEDLLQNGHDDPIVISQIAMDINRTLTDNIFFRKGPGVSKLKQVLLAYSRRNLEVGYCQGMNMIAASLLLIMPSEEDAFWVLCSIVERILPKTYFEPNLLASRADQRVVFRLFRAIYNSFNRRFRFSSTMWRLFFLPFTRTFRT